MTIPTTTDTILRVLANSRQRFVLSYLVENADTVPLDELAAAVVEWEEVTPGADVTAAARDTTCVMLHHRTLPRLEDAGFVRYDSKASTVVLGNNPAIDEPWVRDLLADSDPPADESRDRILDAVSHARRRVVVSILDEITDPISVSDLALQTAAREEAKRLIDVTDSEYGAVRDALYHVHLPTLAEAGLVDYDTTEETVAARGVSELITDFWHRETVESLDSTSRQAHDQVVDVVPVTDDHEEILCQWRELTE